MRQIAGIIQALWQTKLAFRLAGAYLVALSLLLLVLPWLPLAYAPNELDLEQVYLAPFTAQAALNARHWLGTDGLGRDLLANVLYGLRTAFRISVPVMLLATFLGLLLGASAGLQGNQGVRVSRGRMVAALLALPVISWFAVYIPLQLLPYQSGSAPYWASFSLALGLGLLLIGGLGAALKQRAYFRKRVSLPLDHLVLRLVEVQSSIPRLILILVLAAIFPPSLLILAALLVLTFWTGPARLARAEMLRIRELPFFEAATGMGFTTARLMLRHALPHLLAPVAVAFTFGLAGLMMLESTLSFLNIGVDTELVSLGRIIAGIRANTAAWWLVAIPGALLSITVLALQTCSYYLLQGFSKLR